ncbi:MAG TPA: 50S ribosomal protein L33, partial [Candidatus Absconditabacterales bacterium]|nr:50S ribosomal protein L33 [Candidatus Absconditabacterales bacterium]
GAQNYVTTINKTKNPKIELMKYCSQLRKHTLHKSKEKLK